MLRQEGRRGGQDQPRTSRPFGRLRSLSTPTLRRDREGSTVPSFDLTASRGPGVCGSSLNLPKHSQRVRRPHTDRDTQAVVRHTAARPEAADAWRLLARTRSNALRPKAERGLREAAGSWSRCPLWGVPRLQPTAARPRAPQILGYPCFVCKPTSSAGTGKPHNLSERPGRARAPRPSLLTPRGLLPAGSGWPPNQVAQPSHRQTR